MIPMERLHCHAFGHVWDDIGAEKTSRASKYIGFSVYLRCVSCQNVRHDVVDQHGELLYRKYHPTPQYKDDPQHSRAKWRQLWLAAYKKKQKGAA